MAMADGRSDAHLTGEMKTHVAVARRSVGRCSALY